MADQEEVICVFKVEPVGKPRTGYGRAAHRAPPMRRYYKYCEMLRWHAIQAKYTPGPELSLRFVMPMPSSWSGAKKERELGRPCQVKPDLDNLIKAFKDALLDNDSFVWKYGAMTKVWGHEGEIHVLA